MRLSKNCKPIGFLFRTVRTDGQPVTPDEAANSELLHGRAAAVLLQEYYGIHKKSLLNAVRYHTSASAKFDALGRIIYIADKIEPGRKNCDYLREKVEQLTLISVEAFHLDIKNSFCRDFHSC